MEARRDFSVEFIFALDSIKTDINRALIYTIHVVSSKVVEPARKDRFCADLAELGKELRNTILRLDVAGLTDYTLREAETAFIETATILHREFCRLFDEVDRKYGVKMDPLAAFDIADIVSRLKEGGSRLDPLLTRDKIDNLLSIKSLIIEIYESQAKGAVEEEKAKGDEKAFYGIREKTFLQYLHNPENRNPTHFFKISQLVRKLASEGCPVKLGGPQDITEAGVLFVAEGEAGGMAFSYRKAALGLALGLASWKESGKTWYRIQGEVGKPGAGQDFSILEYLMPGSEEGFEKVSGIDFLRVLFEKSLIQDAQDDEAERKRKDDEKKKDIDDSLDDLLFGDGD